MIENGAVGPSSPGDEADRDDRQVSEVSAMPRGLADDPITPGDATAGYPFEEAESGRPDEGTAGPNAAPRHGRTEPSNELSR